MLFPSQLYATERLVATMQAHARVANNWLQRGGIHKGQQYREPCGDEARKRGFGEIVEDCNDQDSKPQLLISVHSEVPYEQSTPCEEQTEQQNHTDQSSIQINIQITVMR